MNLYREIFLNSKKFPSAFWIVIIATLLNQAGNMAFVFIVAYATQHLGFTLSQGANAFAVVSASMLISGIVAGNWIERLGAAYVMLVSVFINGIVLLAISLLHSYSFFLIICIVWGLVFGLYRPACQTLISYLSPQGFQKIAFSFYRLASNLGMSMGPAIGGYLAVHSFPAIFVTNGVANILAGIILVLGLSSSLWIKYRPPSENKKVFTIKWIQYDSRLRLFLIGMIPVSMVFFQHESTLSVYLSQNLGLPISLYGWLFTINTLLIVFFELLLNVATFHWPYRANFILGTIFITAGFAGMYFTTNVWNVIALAVTWTIGEMILFPAASSYIAEIAPEGRRGSYMSLFSTSSNLGMLMGPWIGAVIMQHLSGGALWIMCGVLGIFSIMIFNLVAT